MKIHRCDRTVGIRGNNIVKIREPVRNYFENLIYL